MSRYDEQFELNKKCSPREVRKFVSGALWNDGISIVEYPSGQTVAYGVRYICEFPSLGKIIKKEGNLLHEAIKEQAEELIYRRRRE